MLPQLPLNPPKLGRSPGTLRQRTSPPPGLSTGNRQKDREVCSASLPCSHASNLTQLFLIKSPWLAPRNPGTRGSGKWSFGLPCFCNAERHPGERERGCWLRQPIHIIFHPETQRNCSLLHLWPSRFTSSISACLLPGGPAERGPLSYICHPGCAREPPMTPTRLRLRHNSFNLLSSVKTQKSC